MTFFLFTSVTLRYLKIAYLNNFKQSFFSSPEPKAPGELIGWEGFVVRLSVRPSVVRPPSTISNDFISETTGPIATKFHIQPPRPSGKKNCSNGLGHMTNMATMPIYGKNLKKSSSVKFCHIGFCMGKSENYLFFWKLLQPWVSKLLEVFS